MKYGLSRPCEMVLSTNHICYKLIRENYMNNLLKFLPNILEDLNLISIQYRFIQIIKNFKRNYHLDIFKKIINKSKKNEDIPKFNPRLDLSVNIYKKYDEYSTLSIMIKNYFTNKYIKPSQKNKDSRRFSCVF